MILYLTWRTKAETIWADLKILPGWFPKYSCPQLVRSWLTLTLNIQGFGLAMFMQVWKCSFPQGMNMVKPCAKLVHGQPVQNHQENNAAAISVKASELGEVGPREPVTYLERRPVQNVPNYRGQKHQPQRETGNGAKGWKHGWVGARAPETPFLQTGDRM